MRIKAALLTAALAVGSIGVAQAATPSISDLNLTYDNKGGFSTTLTSYSSFWNAFSQAFNAAGYTSFYGQLKSLYSNIDDYDPTVQFTATKAQKANGILSWGGELSFNDVAKSVSFTSGTFAGSVVQQNPTLATPGPEAGTGLAGLAMAGVGFWAYRRKQQSAAA